MAHEVENMFVVGEPAWHKLGKRFIEAPKTVEDAIVAAGLNWQVGTKTLFTSEGTQVEALATYRDTDNKILGVVGSNYKPLQNIEAFNFFQPFITSGIASFETAGSLKEGKRVWVLAKINDDNMVVKGNDEVSKYILLSNSHDGTLAVRVGFCPIRVVCANTMAMAHSNEGSKLIRIRHVGKVNETLEAVRETMDVMNREFNASLEQYKFLASKQINSSDLEKFIKKVFNTKEQNVEEVESRLVGKIIPLFEKGRGNDMVEIKGTYWAAYNAVSEFLQYERGKSEDTRLDSMWFGQGATLNKKALDLATVLAEAA